MNSVAATVNKPRALLPGCYAMQGVIYLKINMAV